MTETAKYLSEVQWAQPTQNALNDAYEAKLLYDADNARIDTNFELGELNKVVSEQKNNKTPGPNSCEESCSNG